MTGEKKDFSVHSCIVSTSFPSLTKLSPVRYLFSPSQVVRIFKTYIHGERMHYCNNNKKMNCSLCAFCMHRIFIRFSPTVYPFTVGNSKLMIRVKLWEVVCLVFSMIKKIVFKKCGSSWKCAFIFWRTLFIHKDFFLREIIFVEDDHEWRWRCWRQLLRTHTFVLHCASFHLVFFTMTTSTSRWTVNELYLWMQSQGKKEWRILLCVLVQLQ